MRGLNNKVIVVAGAATGIGVAVAGRLAEEGASVVVADINISGARKVVEKIEAGGGTARAFEFDIAHDESVRDLIAFAVSEFGGLDGLHNNAADTSPGTIGRDIDAVEIPLEVWQRTLDVDLTGYLHGVRHAVPELLKRGGGAIVNTSSVVAFMGEPVRPAYAAAKSGILALSRHVAARWGKQGVRCNSIAVGSVETDLNLALVPQEIRDAQLAAAYAPRLGRPADVAALAAFLFSDDAEWLTGQTYHVDGGWSPR